MFRFITDIVVLSLFFLLSLVDPKYQKRKKKLPLVSDYAQEKSFLNTFGPRVAKIIRGLTSQKHVF